MSDCQNLNRLTGNRGRLHSAHWLASSLKLATRYPVSGCGLLVLFFVDVEFYIRHCITVFVSATSTRRSTVAKLCVLVTNVQRGV